jgi:hypothetical protein
MPIVEAHTYVYGQTGVKAWLFADGSDAPAAQISATEQIERHGCYVFTTALQGLYRVDLFNSTLNVPFWGGWVNLGSAGTAICTNERSSNVGAYLEGEDPASLLFVNGPSSLIKVNTDNSVNSMFTGTVQNNYTIPLPIVVASQTPGLIPCVRGDTLSIALPLMGNISSRTRLTFTVKMTSMTLSGIDTDTQAIVQVSEGTGLAVLNGATTVSPADGSLTVTDALSGAVTLVLKPDATAQLPIEDAVWDVQWVAFSGAVATPCSGNFSISADVTQAIN